MKGDTARKRRRALIEALKPHWEALKQAAAEGDKAADSILTCLQMSLLDPRDPSFPGECQRELKAWIQGRSLR